MGTIEEEMIGVFAIGTTTTRRPDVLDPIGFFLLYHLLVIQGYNQHVKLILCILNNLQIINLFCILYIKFYFH